MQSELRENKIHSKNMDDSSINHPDTPCQSGITDECPICLEAFQKKGVVLLYPCHHRYHEACIHKWFGYENSPKQAICPECTGPVQGLVRLKLKYTDDDNGYTPLPTGPPKKKKTFRLPCCCIM